MLHWFRPVRSSILGTSHSTFSSAKKGKVNLFFNTKKYHGTLISVRWPFKKFRKAELVRSKYLLKLLVLEATRNCTGSFLRCSRAGIAMLVDVLCVFQIKTDFLFGILCQTCGSFFWISGSTMCVFVSFGPVKELPRSQSNICGHPGCKTYLYPLNRLKLKHGLEKKKFLRVWDSSISIIISWRKRIKLN